MVLCKFCKMGNDLQNQGDTFLAVSAHQSCEGECGCDSTYHI